MNVIRFIVVFFFILPAVAEKIPNNAWQKGVLDSMSADQIAGPTVMSGEVAIHRTDILTHFILHGTQYIYEATRRTTPRDKALEVTIHGFVEFAVVGSTIYLRDEHGQIHKLALVSKALPSTN